VFFCAFPRFANLLEESAFPFSHLGNQIPGIPSGSRFSGLEVQRPIFSPSIHPTRDGGQSHRVWRSSNDRVQGDARAVPASWNSARSAIAIDESDRVNQTSDLVRSGTLVRSDASNTMSEGPSKSFTKVVEMTLLPTWINSNSTRLVKLGTCFAALG
jgi:hypothetical protein